MSKEGRNLKKQEEEKARMANYEARSKELLAQGYSCSVGTISVLKTNVMAIVTAGPFALLVFFLYFLVWGSMAWNVGLLHILVFFLGMVVSIPVHEFIHGFTWHLFCKNSWQSIHFGVMWDTLTPYCHCKEPLTFKGYVLGGIMPFLVLGLGISALGIALKLPLLLSWGIFNILAAGGDTTICLMLRSHRHSLLLDHPKDCGFVAFSSPQDSSPGAALEK